MPGALKDPALDAFLASLPDGRRSARASSRFQVSFLGYGSEGAAEVRRRKRERAHDLRRAGLRKTGISLPGRPLIVTGVAPIVRDRGDGTARRPARSGRRARRSPARGDPSRAGDADRLVAACATPLQVWTVALLDLLDDAREQLGRPGYEALLDAAIARVGHDAVGIGLDDWRREPRL